MIEQRVEPDDADGAVVQAALELQSLAVGGQSDGLDGDAATTKKVGQVLGINRVVLMGAVAQIECARSCSSLPPRRRIAAGPAFENIDESPHGQQHMRSARQGGGA